jgi:CHASE2 domain-containing sensor protein
MDALITRTAGFHNGRSWALPGMATLLWILAVVLVVAGVLAILRRQLIWGIVLIIVGLLVGPGGVSIFT